jgi:DNA-binding NarL/FixJ family response regulator
MPKPKRAVIADDHVLYRRGLSQLLIDQLAFTEVFEAGSLAQAVTYLTANQQVELALFDLLMPGMAGPNSLSALRASHPATKMAVVAASEQKADILSTIAAGLNGFIPKSLPSLEFIQALESILAGRIYVPGLMTAVDPGASPPLPSDATAHQVPPAPRVKGQLTPRQKEVLDCLKAGMTNRQTAEKLGISIGTVKMHVTALLSAMNLRSRSQFTSAAPPPAKTPSWPSR